MAQYRLLVGIHQGPDREQPPLKRKDPVTGEVTERHPTRTYRQGETIESDTDLTERFGAEKFEYVSGDRKAKAKGPSGDPTPEIARTSPAVAPGGQVSTGYQVTSRGPDGTHVSGAASPEMIDRIQAQTSAEQEPQGAKASAKASAPKKAGRTLEQEYGGDLHSLTVVQLKELAAAEEVELHGAHSKDDIIQAIRKADKDRDK